MVRSVLVPLDGSEFSERSLPLARRIARATGAEMHLAHVHVPYEPASMLSNTQFHYEGLDMGEYDKSRKKTEQDYLGRLADRMGEGGTPVHAEFLEGPSVANELASYAERAHPDLTIITTHGHGTVRRIWLGSVADALIRHTHMPMVVIHPDRPGGVPREADTLEHILIPLDGSMLAESIVLPVSQIAMATKARITLLTVISDRAAIGRSMSPWLPHDVEFAFTEAETYLEELARDLRAMGLETDWKVEIGEAPAHTIARVGRASGADLVAMATHGYGGVKRAIMGSVADEVLRETPLPLFIMRPKDIH